jgi:hypothetical protein
LVRSGYGLVQTCEDNEILSLESPSVRGSLMQCVGGLIELLGAVGTVGRDSGLSLFALLASRRIVDHGEIRRIEHPSTISGARSASYLSLCRWSRQLRPCEGGRLDASGGVALKGDCEKAPRLICGAALRGAINRELKQSALVELHGGESVIANDQRVFRFMTATGVTS